MSPMGCRSSNTWTIFLAFPEALAQNWIRSRGARIEASGQDGCWHPQAAALPAVLQWWPSHLGICPPKMSRQSLKDVHGRIFFSIAWNSKSHVVYKRHYLC